VQPPGYAGSTRRLAGSVALCALAAGCRTDTAPGDAAPPAPVDETPQPAAWQRCTFEPAGIAVEYPADWQTNDGSVMPACSLFDPQPIDVPWASELPADIAVAIHLQDVAFERATGTFGLRVISSEERRVAGRPAVQRLVEQTGDGLLDAGIRTYQYLIDWGDGRTLSAHSHDVGAPDFATKRRVLDEMMARLAQR
jgi:hypothetical protein